MDSNPKATLRIPQKTTSQETTPHRMFEVSVTPKVETMLRAECNHAKAERDHANAELAKITAERDHVNAELVKITAERDHANAELAKIISERDMSCAKAYGTIVTQIWDISLQLVDAKLDLENCIVALQNKDRELDNKNDELRKKKEADKITEGQINFLISMNAGLNQLKSEVNESLMKSKEALSRSRVENAILLQRLEFEMRKNKTSSTPQQEHKQSRGFFGFFSSKRIQMQTPSATTEQRQSVDSNFYEDDWTIM